MVLENGKIINLMQSKIRPIAGDASFRKFYRLTLNKSSKIIALVEKEKYKNLIVCSAINKFLRDNRIFAPRVFTQNYAQELLELISYYLLKNYLLLNMQSNFYTFLFLRK